MKWPIRLFRRQGDGNSNLLGRVPGPDGWLISTELAGYASDHGWLLSISVVSARVRYGPPVFSLVAQRGSVVLARSWFGPWGQTSAESRLVEAMREADADTQGAGSTGAQEVHERSEA